jgi:hypothetical protein
MDFWRAFAGEDFGDFQGTSEVPVCQSPWPSEKRRKSPKASLPVLNPTKARQKCMTASNNCRWSFPAES